jgi:hypothetical protein
MHETVANWARYRPGIILSKECRHSLPIQTSIPPPNVVGERGPDSVNGPPGTTGMCSQGHTYRYRGRRGVRGRPQLGPHRPGGLVHLAREVKPTGAQRSLVRKHPGLIIPPSSIWHPLCVAAQQARVARPRSASWWPKMRRYPHIDRPCNFETPRWVFRYPKTAPAMHPGDGIRSGAVALPRRVFRPTVVAQFAPRWGRRRKNRSKWAGFSWLTVSQPASKALRVPRAP